MDKNLKIFFGIIAISMLLIVVIGGLRIYYAGVNATVEIIKK